MRDYKFSRLVLNWYKTHARQLPWRGSNSPYEIWISEVMLQQTRVEAVIPYFERWMKRFPDIASLAMASQHDVLIAWEGLGYYSRAHNLLRAAQIVVKDFGGELPSDLTSLQKLPGIGRYTAGAIASIAFKLRTPVLDGNVRRLFARYFNVTEPLRSSAAERRLWILAEEHLPSARVGDYNQALMDLGATICKSHQPLCNQCPLFAGCQARSFGLQEERPVKRPSSLLPHYVVTAAVIRRGDQFLITQRPPDGLLGGLWEFPGGKVNPQEELSACLKREMIEEIGVRVEVGELVGVYQHAYTHFRVTVHAFQCTLLDGDQPRSIQVKDLRWVSLDELSDFPMGKIDRQIAKQVAQKLNSHAHR